MRIASWSGQELRPEQLFLRQPTLVSNQFTSERAALVALSRLRTSNSGRAPPWALPKPNATVRPAERKLKKGGVHANAGLRGLSKRPAPQSESRRVARGVCAGWNRFARLTVSQIQRCLRRQKFARPRPIFFACLYPNQRYAKFRWPITSESDPNTDSGGNLFFHFSAEFVSDVDTRETFMRTMFAR